ncbi:MAG: D-glycero-beta-D-manno-heptose-7-phosphate kinase [Chloroherpetonaceae bacterium]|nr:D-glycero-beta-D-manno-heptose-7-phosphate kinase [Chloroherpetonaceae bacterium]MCS7212586.1 D-glycero-beta-D-manno-heptose-7-phosphate kinase [Chloroherpetonaceae bacterium]MDW8020797.1 D-glycero-beta-D-manno-heptose-7-phosphate kinase [Chloroherpetonaceae bacterium]
MSKKLSDLFRSFERQRIAVVGDVMLDRYIFGTVSRISPEAPVPVVDVKEVSHRLGGAANVAMNIHSLGAEALLFGVIGRDDDGSLLVSEMTAEDFSAEFLIVDPSRPTTCKTRVIAQNHHIVRIDAEMRKPISAEIERSLFESLAGQIQRIDAIIFEDYNKGVLTPSLISRITALARKHNVPVAVDPKRENFFAYQKCTLFKPNLKETSDALGEHFANTDEDAARACAALQRRLKSDYVLLTRSEKGATIYNGTAVHIPSVALEVADVSGAGDTVIAVATMGLAAGLDILDAARIANVAAGIVCAEVGAVAVDRQKLYEQCKKHFNSK